MRQSKDEWVIEFLTIVNVQGMVFRDVVPCSVEDSYQCLEGTHTFHPWAARILFCFEYEGAGFLENVEFWMYRWRPQCNVYRWANLEIFRAVHLRIMLFLAVTLCWVTDFNHLTSAVTGKFPCHIPEDWKPLYRLNWLLVRPKSNFPDGSVE